MKKTNYILLIIILIFSQLGCSSDKKPATSETKTAGIKQLNIATNKVTIDPSLKKHSSPESLQTLPDYYPTNNVPLAIDAKLFDIKEVYPSKVLSVMYATDNDIDSICDFYEGAFKSFQKSPTTRNEWADITLIAKNNGATYKIYLWKPGMMQNVPELVEKTIVIMELRDLKNFPDAKN